MPTSLLTLETAMPTADFVIAPTHLLTDTIEAACARVPPLWPLKNFVAVNPFLGLTGATFLQSCALMRRVLHSDTVMPAAFYQEAWDSGKIKVDDLKKALIQMRPHVAAQDLAWLEAQSSEILVDSLSKNAIPAPSADAVLSFADVLDAANKTRWSLFVREEIAKWCAAYYDQGQASWALPWRGESLLAAWKSAAQRDCNPEVAGLPGFRAFVAALPSEPVALIHHVVSSMNVPQAGLEDLLHRQLMTIAGWSGAVQYRVRENGMAGQSDDSLIELLAIRLAYDGALHAAFGSQVATQWEAMSSPETTETAKATPPDLLTLLVWQRALENAYQRALVSQFQTAPAPTSTATVATARPAVQSVFCIDVRSEIYRRALEQASSSIETVGFAGFFGMAIEHVPLGEEKGSAQCPVLLTPQHRIGEDAGTNQEVVLQQKKLSKQLSGAWSQFKSAGVSSFSFVETGGFWAGVQLVKHTFGLEPQAKKAAPCMKLTVASGMSLEKRIEAAQGALKGMSWNDQFARLVLFCGHGSHTTNNPYGSGLDCGACGGHTGQANARVAAAIFNDPAVRAGLKEKGISIPTDTVFLAGLHNTTTDDVSLFDLDSVPSSHQDDLAQLQTWLAQASKVTRQERAAALGLGHVPGQQVDDQVRARATDWAQVRPEWGLAGNAAFIAAPRERTKNLNLGGRSFLHNYDWKLDSDSAVLSLIMNAPMVVASWINLQYFGSTVNNAVLGSGNKVTHNVVGKWGVVQGNGGDLQVGLPLQSLHDGQKWVHQPLRLSVFIEAPHERISAIIEAHENVRNLVDNDWLHLFALENEGQTLLRYVGKGKWHREMAK